MKHEQVLLELNVDEPLNPSPAALAAQDRAVRQVKVQFQERASQLDCWVPELKLGGLQNLFPVLTVSGPVRAVERFSKQVLHAAPDLVRSISRIIIKGF